MPSAQLLRNCRASGFHACWAWGAGKGLRKMPKRAVTGFFVFASEERKSVAGELRAASENAAVPAVSRLLGQRWRDLPEEQKAIYKAKAAEKQKEQVLVVHLGYGAAGVWARGLEGVLGDARTRLGGCGEGKRGVVSVGGWVGDDLGRKMKMEGMMVLVV